MAAAVPNDPSSQLSLPNGAVAPGGSPYFSPEQVAAAQALFRSMQPAPPLRDPASTLSLPAVPTVQDFVKRRLSEPSSYHSPEKKAQPAGTRG